MDDIHIHIIERTGVMGHSTFDRRVPCSRCSWGHPTHGFKAVQHADDKVFAMTYKGDVYRVSLDSEDRPIIELASVNTHQFPQK